MCGVSSVAAGTPATGRSRTLKADLTRYRETGEETDAPSLAGLRKRWNQVKDTECVDADTGQIVVARDQQGGVR